MDFIFDNLPVLLIVLFAIVVVLSLHSPSTPEQAPLLPQHVYHTTTSFAGTPQFVASHQNTPYDTLPQASTRPASTTPYSPPDAESATSNPFDNYLRRIREAEAAAQRDRESQRQALTWVDVVRGQAAEAERQKTIVEQQQQRAEAAQRQQEQEEEQRAAATRRQQEQERLRSEALNERLHTLVNKVPQAPVQSPQGRSQAVGSSQQGISDGTRPSNFVASSQPEDPHHLSLREQALEAGRQMDVFRESAKNARAHRDRALARILEAEAQRYRSEMERLNEQASKGIFEQKNKNLKGNKIDLHGLYVKEAERYVLEALERARANGDARLSFIVGKGSHSPDKVPKIRPAIEELLRKNGHEPKSLRKNPGVLVVQLRPSRKPRSNDSNM